MLEIITHSGKFHTDEVFAVAFLMKIHDVIDFSHIKLDRTREKSKISSALSNPLIYVVDVGGEHKPEKNNFDHHQKNCNESYSGFTIPLSSFGMVYQHFQDRLFGDLGDRATGDMKRKFYKTFILPIDAADNGVPDVEYKFGSTLFHCRNYYGLTLQSIISSFNHSDVSDFEFQDNRFKMAVNIARGILENWVSTTIRKVVEFELCDKRVRSCISPMQEIVVFDERFPYSKALFAFEQEYNKTHWNKWKIQLIVVPNADGESWNIHTVHEQNKFKLRTPIIIRCDENIYVHKNRFFAKTNDKNMAIGLAQESLNLQKSVKQKKIAKILFGGAFIVSNMLYFALSKKK